MTPATEAVLDEHLAAENAHDLGRIMATYGDSPVIVLNGRPIAGHAAIAEFHRTFGFGGSGSFSAVRVDECRRHRTADAVIIEQKLTGVHTGTWLGHAPTGRAFELAVCTVYTFDATARLAAEHVYFDAAWLARQIAAHPTGRGDSAAR
jgi:SnoaL-like polyketide cyclase